MQKWSSLFRTIPCFAQWNHTAVVTVTHCSPETFRIYAKMIKSLLRHSVFHTVNLYCFGQSPFTRNIQDWCKNDQVCPLLFPVSHSETILLWSVTVHQKHKGGCKNDHVSPFLFTVPFHLLSIHAILLELHSLLVNLRMKLLQYSILVWLQFFPNICDN